MSLPARRPLVVGLAVALVAAACASTLGVWSAGGARAATTTTTPRLPLQGTNWVLTDRVSIGTPLEDVAVNAVFDGKRVGGTSGCNGYSRSYTVNESRMTIANDGVSTQISCGGAADKVERRYLAALDRVRRFRISGSTLTLSTATGRRVVVFRASVGEAALRGTWNVTGFYTGSAIQSPATGSNLTIEFTGERVAGDSGCNTFSGPYQLAGTDGITIGPLASTLRACADPARDTQERQYLAALGLARTYQVTGRSLTLYRDGGTIAVQYERARS
jgi:heat shock protein HslJ